MVACRRRRAASGPGGRASRGLVRGLGRGARRGRVGARRDPGGARLAGGRLRRAFPCCFQCHRRQGGPLLRRWVDRVSRRRRWRRRAAGASGGSASCALVRILRPCARARAGDGRGAFEALGGPTSATASLSGASRISSGGPRRCLASAAYELSPFGLIPGAEGHREAVRTAVEYIHRGDIFQTNICLRAEAAFAGDPLDAFCQLGGGSPPALRLLRRSLRAR